MRVVKDLYNGLLSLGIATGLFLGALSGEAVAGLGIATFYLFFQYTPYLPWVKRLEEDILVKYIIINILGFFFNPILYYFLNIFGAPIAVSTTALVSLLIFIFGLFFIYFKAQKDH